MRASCVALVSFVFGLAGCLSLPAIPPRSDGGPRDAGLDAPLPRFALAGIDVVDGRGQAAHTDDAPRRPSIIVRFSSPPADPSLVLLVSGAADADLVADLDATPLRVSTLDRAIEIDARLAHATLTITPTEPLVRGATVTLAIPRWLADASGHRLDAASTETLTISSRLDAGARATDAWPPDGAFDVAPALALAAIRFDGSVEDSAHAIVLSETDGGFVSATPTLAPCSTIGWLDGVCVELLPVTPLRPSTPYTLAVAPSARDARGATMPAFESHFTTAASAPAPLAWSPISCTIGETPSSEGCARTDDESVSFRGQLSAAVRLSWTTGAAAGSLVAGRGALALRVDGLSANTPTSLGLDAADYAGAHTLLTLPLTTTEPLPTLSITEVRADPFGLEPRQEYVEIENYGSASVLLTGMRLADSTTALGDVLPSASIPAGAHALIVSSDFNPDDTASGGDVAVPAGTLLVRVDASLGSGGLSNSGEPVFLRDSMDRWISAAPATPAPRQGVCIVRTSTSHRTGEPGSFGYDPALTCTPGR